MPSQESSTPTSARQMPHIGRLIETRMVGARMRQVDVAQRMGVVPSAVKRYFSQESVQLGIVWKMGLALERNLLAEVAEVFPIAPAAGSALLEAQARIADLEKELAIYKSIVTGKGG